MTLTEEQKNKLVAVLTAAEIEGASHPALRCDPVTYATSAFSLWHREPGNEGFVGDAAIETFCAARRTAIATLKSVPADSMVLLRVSEGCDPLKLAARWNAFRAAKR
jgi:hypothetical protein